MIVPQIDVDAVALGSVETPQLAQREAHAIAVLRLLAEPHAIGIGEDEHPMVAIDEATLRARVARQPRVAGRVNVAGQHPIARFEACPLAFRATRAVALE